MRPLDAVFRGLAGSAFRQRFRLAPREHVVAAIARWLAAADAAGEAGSATGGPAAR